MYGPLDCIKYVHDDAVLCGIRGLERRGARGAGFDRRAVRKCLRHTLWKHLVRPGLSPDRRRIMLRVAGIVLGAKGYWKMMRILRATACALVLAAALQQVAAAGPDSAASGGAAAAASQGLGASEASEAPTEAEIAEVTRRIMLGMFAVGRYDGEGALVELNAALSLPGLSAIPPAAHFDLLVFKGIAEGMTEDLESAYASLRKAEAYAPEARDITYWIALASITTRSGRLEEGIDAALAMVRDYPGEVAMWEQSVPSIIMMTRDLRDSSARLELLERLWHMDFRPSDGDELAEWLLRELLGLYAERGDDENAIQVMAELQQPASLAMLRYDNRFARFAASNKLGGYALAQERALAAAEAAMNSSPRQLKTVNAFARLLRENDRPEEALALVDAALARVAAGDDFDDLAESLQWTYAQRADLLVILGHPDEAIAAMRMAVTASERDQMNGQANQIINLAGFLVRVQRPGEALAALEDLNLFQTTPNGAVAQAATKVCSYEQLGETANARLALDYVLANATEAYRAVKFALLCSNDADELARQMIAMLDNPMTRADVLEDVQTYLNPPIEVTFVRLLNQRYEAVKARPDVAAAIAKYGKVLSWPTYGPWN